jgi:DNA replication ATP-dependent helicase Dna2
LQKLFEEKTSHLTTEHAAFFARWEELVSLEEREMVRFKKEIWTMKAEERQKAGRWVQESFDNLGADGAD